MEEPITLHFQWTAYDLLRARHWHFRHTCRRPFRWLTHFTLILIMALCLMSLALVQFSYTALGILLIGLYIYLIRPHEVRWHTRRHFAKRPDHDVTIQWRITSEKLSATTPQSSSECQWQALSHVIQAPDGFLFYSTDQIYNYLPRRGFSSESDFQRLSQMAQRHAAKFSRVS